MKYLRKVLNDVNTLLKIYIEKKGTNVIPRLMNFALLIEQYPMSK